MPVLMNKGDDPRQAAWLFYTDRAALDEWGRAIVEGRFDSGVLEADPADVEAAKKASSEVPVYLAVRELVPEDFDLESARGEVMTKTEAALERAKQAAEEGADPAEALAGDEGGEADPDDIFDYEPVPAPEGLRVRVGTTTAQAARSYLLPADENGEDASGENGDGAEDKPARDNSLPGLQMLGQLIDLMRSSGKGMPACVVWHVDETGVLRMVPGKKVKPMAGNILSVKQ